ncbi:unnamed protein product [Thelazia callipaeda]|uniref:Translocon-associated protein subunit alpha n=1 Tax=Thelazia callipaeda TaxID=103827 RepID=A0A0N5CKK2_THECL|nr:unnamed protein product [Thelazia callipaeda]
MLLNIQDGNVLIHVSYPLVYPVISSTEAPIESPVMFQIPQLKVDKPKEFLFQPDFAGGVHGYTVRIRLVVEVQNPPKPVLLMFFMGTPSATIHTEYKEFWPLSAFVGILFGGCSSEVSSPILYSRLLSAAYPQMLLCLALSM